MTKKCSNFEKFEQSGLVVQATGELHVSTYETAKSNGRLITKNMT